MVKKCLAVFIVIFFSCQTEKSTEWLYPIPTLRVKMGEQKQFDLSNYFIKNDLDLNLIEQNPGISLHEAILNVDGSFFNIGITKLPINVNGQELTLLIDCEKLVVHTFKLTDPNAENVVVMGAFNDWSHTALPLEKNGIEFSRSVYMEPKKHEYKFIIDGREEIDPANPIFISNNIGSSSS